MSDYPNTQLFIDNRWVDGIGEPITVSDPATGRVIGTVQHALESDLDLALDAASRGFAVWRSTSAFDRSRLLRAAAGLLRERAPRISELLTREQGKPLAQARDEVLGSAEILDWFAEEARRTYGRVIPERKPDVTQTVRKTPIGPVAAFTPWNFPVNQAAEKLGAALAAGCSVILKSPEETPAAPAALVQVLADSGLPAGVVNLVFGTPSRISEYLVPHPAIRKVSFTGSTAVGKQLAALAGAHMKPVTMELGGHAPVLVFDDADIDRAIAMTVESKHLNAGQVCVAPTRFLVQDRVADRFVEGYIAACARLKIGNGLEPFTDMGPLANARRVDAIEATIRDSVQAGARLAFGGERIGNAGHFFQPTVLTDVPVSARIMNEEPFGPVSIINRFATIEEAIEEANRLRYGLAAYSYTRSSRTARQLASRVEAGMLAINNVSISYPETPFGGIGDSGYGREGGIEAMDSYLETRFVTHAV